ncbi:MAG: SDR family oxidoreductase [Ignavibacteriales bacterium]|nr:SDR family oxidoreductase [Ignavibacteriales bacterium]
MDFGLQNKVALVAAASEGLGKASALALAKEGAAVAVCSRREQEIRAAAAEIHSATGSTVHPFVCDVSNASDIKRWVDDAAQKFGTIHILVNNAGGPPTGSISSLTDEQWEAGFELTMMSVVRLTRAVLPLMEQQRWGRVITIASFVAKEPLNELLLSSSIRPGILGMTKALSSQYASKGITVNTVCPGYILTKRQDELLRSRAAQQNVSKEEYLREQARLIPAGRLGRPEEIGSVVAFLASEHAGYISGVNVMVDGGLAKAIH